MIRVENKVKKIVPRFWDGAVFHPTDAIEDDWGQDLLRRMASDGGIRVIRLYTMFEDMVSLDEKGEMIFDFTLNDQRLDFLLSLGFLPVISYAFLPPWLCVHTDLGSSVAKNKTRYKGKVITNSYAKDPEKWGEICRIYTQHIVDRYGAEQVRSWRMICFNEPDLKSFFMAEAGESRDTNAVALRLREYLKLYKAFARGVKSVDEKIPVGNSLAYIGEFLDGFLKEISESRTPIDFVGIHTYGTGVALLNSGERPFDARANITKERAYREIIRKYYDPELPILCDEWGAAASGFLNVEECPQMIFREKSAFAAYFGQFITHYADEDRRPEKVMICLSGQHEMTTDFSGFRNFFTLHRVKKPVYNAHILASKLGEEMLCRSGEPENVTVYPTKREDGSVAILLAYAAPHFDEFLPKKTVEIDLSGWEVTGQATLWRIDPEHCDPYARFLREGMADPLTKEQIAHLTEEGNLKSEPISWDASEPLKLTLTCDGLYLIELERKKS